jgi:hypothetical protein
MSQISFDFLLYLTSVSPYRKTRIFPAYPHRQGAVPVFQFLLVFTENRPIYSRNFFYKHLNHTTMSFKKVFIGKGRQVPNMNVARVTIPLHKLQEIAYEKEGVMYCTFEVSKMKQPDNFGREYTVSYSKLIPEANSPHRKKKRKAADQENQSRKLPENLCRSKLKS